MSPASRGSTASGSAARRTPSSTAIRTSIRRRRAASSASVAHGCSTYSSRRPGPARRSARLRCRRPRRVGVDADGPGRTEGVADRLDPRQVVAGGLPGSATLTFAVRQPEAVTIACACSGPTAGTVTLTGTALRTGGGQPSTAASSAAAHQRRHSVVS